MNHYPMHLVWTFVCCLWLRVQADILIKNGQVVNADRQFQADVLIKDGKIVAVEPRIEAVSGVRVIDAQGSYVMPGGIDPHTHMELFFMGHIACDDFFSGQAAALAGGTTMHIDFATSENGDLEDGFKFYKEISKKSCMDYGFHMVVTSWNEKVSRDMELMVKEGINSFKFFMAYKESVMVNDETLINGFQRCKELGALPMIHAENGDAVVFGRQKVFDSGITAPYGHGLSRPPCVEAEATNRAIRLAEFVDVPLYVVHVTSEEAMLEVVKAKKKGRHVFGEPLCVGLAMNEDKMKDPDFKIAAQYVMSPPIRTERDREALKKALTGGVLDLVGTDHAVFNSTQKASGRNDFRRIPNGVNGIEERMHIVWDEMVNSGLMGPTDFVRVTSTQAAKIFNIYPQKGVIEVGADADIIVFNPQTQHVIRAATHHSRMDTNIYEGRKIKGKVETTISRGRIVWENGKLNVEPGTGRYIPMKPFPNYFVQKTKDWVPERHPSKDEL